MNFHVTVDGSVVDQEKRPYIIVAPAQPIVLLETSRWQTSWYKTALVLM